MPTMSRRDLLAAGLAISGAAFVTRSAWGLASATVADEAHAETEAGAAIAPREHLQFDFGWRFKFGHGSDPAKDLGFGFGQEDFAKTGDFRFARPGFDDSNWRALNLPHDWAVELPFVHDDEQDLSHGDDPDYKLMSHGYKPLGRRYPETSIGWYRREFEIPSSDEG